MAIPKTRLREWVRKLQEENRSCENVKMVRSILLNNMLFLTVAFSALLIPFNLFIAHDTSLVAFDLFIFIFASVSFYLSSVKQNYRIAAYLGTLTLFITFFGVLVIDQGRDYSLIWSYFFAPFVIIILGIRHGLGIAILFLSAVFLLAFSGIGSWMEGTWNIQSFVRFVLAHIALTYIIYTTMKNNEKAFAKITELRAHEQEQLKLFEKLSITDPLTALYNRRFLKEVFPEQYRHAAEHGQYFAFFLLDVDHFKSFNDTYGHHKGDILLNEIADLFHEHIKYGFRIGGDEFAGIVTGESESDIKKIIETFYHAIRSLEIPNTQNPISARLSCSIGVYISAAKEHELHTVYQFADTALYRAKAEGRDRIVYYESDIQ